MLLFIFVVGGVAILALSGAKLKKSPSFSSNKQLEDCRRLLIA